MSFRPWRGTDVRSTTTSGPATARRPSSSRRSIHRQGDCPGDRRLAGNRQPGLEAAVDSFRRVELFPDVLLFRRMMP
jgi:hypothetical protein